MITSVKDLEYIMGWGVEKPKLHQGQIEIFVKLDEDEKYLYKSMINSEKILLDQLALESKLSIQKTLMLLLQLELKGLVRSLPGKWYEAIQV